MDSANGAKMALKAREFGREITNAAASSTNASSNANKQNHSVILEQNSFSQVASAQSAQNSSVIISSSSQVNGTAPNLANSRKVSDSGAHSNKMVSKNIKF